MRPGADGAPASRPPAWLTEEAADRAVLRLKVVPRAARTAIAGVCGDALRIRLSAPPADGKANAALVGFLSDSLGVPARQVTILTGAAARIKRVRVQGLPAARIPRRLLATSGPA